jgi:hypothetical protein
MRNRGRDLRHGRGDRARIGVQQRAVGGRREDRVDRRGACALDGAERGTIEWHPSDMELLHGISTAAAGAVALA